MDDRVLVDQRRRHGIPNQPAWLQDVYPRPIHSLIWCQPIFPTLFSADDVCHLRLPLR